jgi:cytochrome c-type biogenesis protein CcmH/NrfG/O-antigen ligase
MVLQKTLRYLVLGGIFLLPFVCLIVTSSLFFPYITGKNFAFRIIVEIITGAWLALALVDPQYRPRRSWILACFAIFIMVIAIADAQGANPFKSFWSNYERMDGWVTIAHLFAYLLVVVSVLNTEKLWRLLMQLSLAVSVFAAVYGFLQIAGALALGEGGSAGLSARIDATFGNPIYLAAYMLFHVFIAALLWAQMWKERGPGNRLPFSLLYGCAIVLDTLALLFTGTRGTTFGLIGGGILSLIIFVCMPGASKRLRQASVAIVAIVLLFSGGLWLARNSTLVSNIGFLQRLATISLGENTVKARFINIQIAWQGVKEKPLLGWGQENYAIVFDKYYDPRMYGQEPWFDRVHDSIFDWWIAGGTLGLLAYLSIFFATMGALWKGKAFSTIERSILTGLLAGYFVHNLFVFDNVTSYILFATILGYIAWRAGEARNAQRVIEGKFMPEAALPFVAVIAALVVWGAAWWVNASALVANRTLLTALEPQSSGILTNLKYFEQAISYGTYGTQEAREQLVQAASQVASAQSVDTASKQQFLQTAATEMIAQEKVSPLDARFPLFLGILFDSYGDYPDATKALAQAHALSPKKQSILFAVAQNQEAQGDNAGALQTFAEAYNLDTDDTNARLFYAATAITLNQDQLADTLLAPIIASGDAADPRIAAAYVARKRFDKIVMIWQAHVKAQPDDVQGYLTLAAAYYEAGDKANAVATLKEVEKISPDTKSQVDLLIQQVQNGTAQIGQ